MKKRIISAVLSATVLVSLSPVIPGQAEAAESSLTTPKMVI